ncbi:MAG TPA: hypothetical protein VLM18_00510 [Croceibacterium sp.]|nr:hypothetical protein [Croceibacterium sp.]
MSTSTAACDDAISCNILLFASASASANATISVADCSACRSTSARRWANSPLAHTANITMASRTRPAAASISSDCQDNLPATEPLNFYATTPRDSPVRGRWGSNFSPSIT